MIKIYNFIAYPSLRINWIKLIFGYIGIAVITHSLIIFTNGFYSHDEWQKFDHMLYSGFENYLQTYGKIYAGPEFGFPVRPFGFIQQGISSVWMKAAPIIPHMVDVLIHAAIGIVLVLVMREAGAAADVAYLTALFFLMSPLTTLATGWVAASFDQWYCFFILLTCLFSQKIWKSGFSFGKGFAILLFSSSAILSKETAFVLPVILVLCWVLGIIISKQPLMLNWKTLFATEGIVLIPLVVFFIIRLPALQATLAGAGVATYAPSISNVPYNALGYFAFPFLLKISDLQILSLIALKWVWLAAGIHCLVVILIARNFGFLLVFLYIASYFIFLIPVITLPNLGSHYLYASSLAMSIGIGFLFMNALKSNRVVELVFLSACVLCLVLHNLASQAMVYHTGECQNTFLTTLDSRMHLEKAKGTAVLGVVPEDGAPGHIGIRAIFSRAVYAGVSGPRIVMDENVIKKEKIITLFKMNKLCEIE